MIALPASRAPAPAWLSRQSRQGRWWMLAVMLCLMWPCARASAQTAAPADSAWSRGDRATARRLYLERLEEQPDDATALFRLALLAGWQGHHRESVGWLDLLLRIQPADREARTLRARAIAALGDLQSARAIVDSVLAVWPDDIGALQASARFTAWDGDLAASERLYRRALAVDPHNSETATGLAQTLRWQGRMADAWRILEPVTVAEPSNEDARVQADWIAAAYRPRARSGVVHERDSDANLVSSLILGASARLADPLEVHADAWLRTADLRVGGDRGLTARGGLVGLRWEASGWTLDAAAGLSAATGDSPARSAFSAAATSPRRNRLVVDVALSRTPFDYTVPLVENGVSVDDGTLRLDYRSSRDWAFAAAMAIARFDVARSDSTSRRTSALLAVTRRINDAFFTVLGVRAFGFDRDLAGGFFDPDFYGIADAALAWRREGRQWTFEADAAPGVQRIGGDGPVTGALRAAASASWAIRPGRRIILRGVWANTGQLLSSAAGAAYRYRSVSLSTSWWF